MNIRTLALATTALVLPLAASANDNSAFLDQFGNNNEALVTQDGNANRAGTDAETRNNPTLTREARQVMTQNGNNNSLILTQTGRSNEFTNFSEQRIGRGSDADGFGIGFDQTGNANRAEVTQTGRDNGMARLQQLNGNSAFIDQFGGEYTGGQSRPANYITTLFQENTGGMRNVARVDQSRTDFSNAAGGNNGANIIGEAGGPSRVGRGGGGMFQVGVENTLRIIQDGSRNEIFSTDQSGASNQLLMRQEGFNNFVGTVTQNSTGANGNEATIRQIGEGNNRSGFTSLSFSNATSLLGGAAFADVTQLGENNSLNYLARGDFNAMGFLQDGNNNTVGNVTVIGDGNETAAVQIGDGNTASIAPIVGTDNDVGVGQGGDGNMATVTISAGGSFNNFGVGQIGNTNTATLTGSGNGNIGAIVQFGDLNTATVSADGDGNIVGGASIGDMNTITVAVTGSGNLAAVGQLGFMNSASLTVIGNGNGGGAFSGDAQSANFAGQFLNVALSGFVPATFGSGLVGQIGDMNAFTGEITGNNNEFGAVQLGDDNTITATVTGNMNQFAVAQLSSSNVATVTQMGNGNNAGVLQ
ncbi:MAG: hypothetical protein AAFM92_08390 [Pseudomonadota bacterium]